MASDDDVSERTDDDVLGPEYPPDRPMGVTQYGTTAQEERVDEPIDERVRREEPDDGAAPDAAVQLLDETADALDEASDLDAGETGDWVLGELGDRDGPGDDRGPTLGPPPSLTASDRVPMPAEESAVHLVEGDADLDDDGEP